MNYFSVHTSLIGSNCSFSKVECSRELSSCTGNREKKSSVRGQVSLLNVYYLYSKKTTTTTKNILIIDINEIC